MSKHHHRHSIKESYDNWYFGNDSLGPDPYEVLDGFKMLPRYECRLCGEFFPTDELKEASRFDFSLGIWDDPKPICRKHAREVESMRDWRVW